MYCRIRPVAAEAAGGHSAAAADGAAGSAAAGQSLVCRVFSCCFMFVHIKCLNPNRSSAS